MSTQPVPSASEQVKSPEVVRWWQMAIALVLTGGLIAGIVWLIRASANTFTHLPSGTATAIVTASATVLVATGSILVTRIFERRSNRERDQQAKRVPVYEEFVKGLLEMMGATKNSNVAQTDTLPFDTDAFFARFTERVIIWGSEKVVREWVSLRRATFNAQSEEEKYANLYRLESLFLEIRSDRGLRNKGLERGDLLRLWINDL